MPAPPQCPNCNASLSPNARGCSCGASEASKWVDPHAYDGVDLPGDDDDFDYDAFIEEEFGRKKPGMSRPAIGWGWWVVGVLLVIAMVLGVMGGSLF